MKVSREIRLLTMAFTLSFISNIANAQQGQPVWTDILTMPNQSSMQSGNYWQIGPNPQPGTVFNTYLDGINHMVSLSVATLTGANDQTGNGSCGSVGSPATYIETNKGFGIKGVGFLGAFNAQAGGVPLTYYPNNNLFEAVFFHE